MLKRRMHVTLLILTVLSLVGTTARAGRAQATEDRRVTVIIPESYPAFQPAATLHPRARELRALVIRRDPTTRTSTADASPSVILLHPAHVNSRTLADAVTALHTCPRPAADGSVPNFAPIFVSSPSRGGVRRDAETWEAHLSELEAQPRTEFPGLRTAGRSITITLAIPLCPSRPQGG